MTSPLLMKLRAAARRYLTDRCTLERETRTPGVYGDLARTWTVIASDVPCRVIMARRTELTGSGVTALRETLETSYRIALPPDVAVQVDDRVTVGGVVYGVVHLEAALTHPIFVQAVIARR